MQRLLACKVPRTSITQTIVAAEVAEEVIEAAVVARSTTIRQTTTEGEVAEAPIKGVAAMVAMAVVAMVAMAVVITMRAGIHTSSSIAEAVEAATNRSREQLRHGAEGITKGRAEGEEAAIQTITSSNSSNMGTSRDNVSRRTMIKCESSI